MRVSTRDKRTFYYATYVSKTEKTETIGTGQNAQTIKLGEYTITYAKPQKVFAYVSIPRMMANANSGTAKVEPYGVDTMYRRYIISEQAITSLAVDSVCWIDVEPEMDEQTHLPKSNGNVAPDYRVTRVAHSFHHYIYEVQEY